MKYVIALVLFFVLSTYIPLKADEPIDTTSSQLNEPTSEIITDVPTLTKSPTGASLRSLAVPGWGQIYVEQYIKAPLFFGAAVALWYNIISNHISSNDYKNQLKNYTDKTTFEYQIASAKMENAIDNRDLSALYLIGVYVLSIIDAYSGAHLFDFKILDLNTNINFTTQKYNWGYAPQFNISIVF